MFAFKHTGQATPHRKMEKVKFDLVTEGITVLNGHMTNLLAVDK